MKLKIWEAALIAAVLIAVLAGFKLGDEQKEIAERVVRLHVVANSDSEADQELKLKVRDAVLAALSPRLEGASDASAAEAAVAACLGELEKTAAETVEANGYDYPVSVALGAEDFPTREYETFTLPAGEYRALRVTIGEGAGHNWWCVVFPPICAEAAVDWSSAGLTESQVMLITCEEDGYIVKFKAMELLAKIREWFK